MQRHRLLGHLYMDPSFSIKLRSWADHLKSWKVLLPPHAELTFSNLDTHERDQTKTHEYLSMNIFIVIISRLLSTSEEPTCEARSKFNMFKCFSTTGCSDSDPPWSNSKKIYNIQVSWCGDGAIMITNFLDREWNPVSDSISLTKHLFELPVLRRGTTSHDEW